jgi:hypothetical protein
LPPLVLDLIIVTYQATPGFLWELVEGQLYLSYAATLVMGLPAVTALRIADRNSAPLYAMVGAAIGIVTYFITWEILPILPAYLDHRISLSEAATSLLLLEYPSLVLWYRDR